MTKNRFLVAPEISAQTYASPASMYLAGLSTSSRTCQARALNRVLRVIAPGATIDEYPWHRLTVPTMLALRESLATAKIVPSSANRYLGAVKSVIRACWRMDLISHEQMARLCDVPSVRGKRLPKRRKALTATQLVWLVDAANKGSSDWYRRRDALLVALLYAGGLRRAEVCSLNIEDLEFEEESIHVTVIGKGNKQREIWVSNALRRYFDAWFDVRGRGPGPLFPRRSGERPHLQPQACARRIEWLARTAQIGKVTTHDLRRTCLTAMLDAGVDLVVVRDFAGHEDIATTARYDLRGVRAVRAAALRLPMPF